jgi:hypothetical protein
MFRRNFSWSRRRRRRRRRGIVNAADVTVDDEMISLLGFRVIEAPTGKKYD